MVRTLVITVDRDNDLGIKAAIRGPVIGRKAVLTAALRLGIADPEESDTNAILGALHHHDRISESTDGEEVEVAILTGDEKVGPKSDRAIAAQLEEVVNQFQPDRAILITDGAEDESVLPILQSQVRIDHVQKIIVKQSKGIEGTYYFIAKTMEDPMWRAKMLVPIATIMMIYGMGIMLPQESGGDILIGGLPFFIGAFLLSKGLGVETTVAKVISEMRENANAAMFSSLMWVGAVLSAIFAVAQGYGSFNDELENESALSIAYLTSLHTSLAWIMIVFLLIIGGLMLLRLKRGSFSGSVFILAAFGMVAYSFLNTGIDLSIKALQGATYEFSIRQIFADWSEPIVWLAILWMTMLVVKAIKQRQESRGESFWGI
jgi:putative membrane protein